VRTRSLVFGITLMAAVALAAVAVATIVILDAPDEVAVIASRENIPANELLYPLVEKNLFKEILVQPTCSWMERSGDVNELRGTITTTPIIANEPVSHLPPPERGHTLRLNGVGIQPVGAIHADESRPRTSAVQIRSQVSNSASAPRPQVLVTPGWSRQAATRLVRLTSQPFPILLEHGGKHRHDWNPRPAP
jgi:hypothetical protein